MIPYSHRYFHAILFTALLSTTIIIHQPFWSFNAAFGEQVRNLILAGEKSEHNKKIDSATVAAHNEKVQKYGLAATGIDDGIRVILELDDASSSDIEALQKLGVHIESNYDDQLQVIIPLTKLETIANLEFIKFVRQPYYALPSLTSEGVSAIKADEAQLAGFSGDGVKVAIIDAGFDTSSPEISANIVEAISFRADGDIETSDPSHGTAVAEIIVDVAPAVDLYLYNVLTDIEVLNAIDYIIDQNQAGIISMSLAWFNVGLYDGSSSISQAVNSARDSGILFIVAGGNSAKSHWEGQFSDSDGDKFHNFSGDDETIAIQAATGEEVMLFLNWNDNWSASTQDFDLYVFDHLLNLIAFSENVQSGSGSHPTETIYLVAPYTDTFHIVIRKDSANSNPTFDLFVYPKQLEEYQVSSGSIPIPADASGAFTVGAAYWETGLTEDFSSRGPTNDGRIKPDVSGPDGVTTSALNPFFGTSAAAPHVAGAAAQLKSAYDNIDADNLQALLEENTFNNHVKNNNDGTGIVDLTFIASGTISFNNSPVANAGADQLVDEGSVVTLDGSGSHDNDVDDVLSYTWVQVLGPSVTLSDYSSVQPIFTAPDVTETTVLSFELVVDDGLISSPSDTTTVTINNILTSFTFTESGKSSLKKATSGFAKGNHEISVEISADYELDNKGKVVVNKDSISGILIIDPDTASEISYDLNVKKVTISKNLKKITYSAKPIGVSGSISGTLTFSSAIDFESGEDKTALAKKNKLTVKIEKANFTLKKPDGSTAFG